MSLTELVKNSEYLILLNGSKVSGNGSLTFDKDGKLSVIHDINQKTNIDILVKRGVNAKMLEIFNEVDSDVCINLVLEDGSSLEYTTLRRSAHASNFNLDISLGSGAKLDSKSVSILSGESSFNNNVLMQGEGSTSVSMDVVINASGKKQVYNYETNHKGNNSTSTMRNFVINKNGSITFMNTNGIIEKYVKGVVISQKTKGLLLDEASEISANPILTIDEYDCNASHGASIGAIDEDELYYLMSRGLTKESSEKLIIGGFVSPFLSSIKDEAIKDELYKIIDKVL